MEMEASASRDFRESTVQAVQVESAEVGEVDLAESVTVHLDRELAGWPQLRVEQFGHGLPPGLRRASIQRSSIQRGTIHC